MVNAITTVVKVNDLHKDYDGVHAVRGVNFEVQQGEIFGLIGPDGAGKTSIFKIFAGIMPQTSGDVSILGKIPKDARLETGFLTQYFSFYEDLTIDENLRYSAGLRKVPKNLFRERRSKYLHLMGIEKFSNRLAGQLSGGMKQKLALCCVLIFQPKILLLDEPTTGVDPISRREFWDILAALSTENTTIVIATPYMDEAERCTRIALMYDGQFQEIGTPKQIKEGLNLKRLEIYTTHIDKTREIISKSAPSWGSLITDIQTYGDRLDVLTTNLQEGESRIKSVLELNNSSPGDIRPAEITLENVFVTRLKEKDSKLEYKAFPFEKPHVDNNKAAIGAYSLNKTFGDFQAVKDVTLEVKYGEIFGLLGANGAGKTTTIKMLCGLLNPTSGEINLAGEAQNLRSTELRHKIGYMSQKFTLYNDLTIFENLRFYSGVYSVPSDAQNSKINWVLVTSGLAGQENLMTGALPGGWKQRVAFGASVMHEPDILFLDEPTSGVDPLARRQFWRLIRDFARHGTAILVTTHYLEEAENCNRIAFMAAGEIVAKGTPGEIRLSQPGKLFEMITTEPQKATILLKNILQSWKVSLFGDRLHIVLDNPDVEMPNISSYLESNQIQIISGYQIPFSLEDAFIGIIERSGKRS